VSNLLQVRAGESRRTGMLFAYLFLVVSSYIVTKTTRDALFLGRYPASALPYADIASALAVAVVMAVYLRVGRRVPLPALIIGTLVVFAATALMFWGLARGVEPSWLLPTLYVWASVGGVLLPAQVWTLASRVLTPREAKRLFGIVAAGAISGSIAGGFIAASLATRIGTRNLLLFMAASTGACTLLVAALWRARPSGAAVEDAHAAAPAGVIANVRVVADSPLLRSVAALVGISALVTTVAAWQFRAVAKAYLPDTNELTAFFGAFTTYAGVVSLAVQVLVAPRVVRRYGVGVALLIVPAVLAFGSTALFASGALWAAVVLRSGDQVLRYSIDRPAVELLYLPVPAAMLSRAKAFIDTVVLRFGDASGALLALALVWMGISPSRASAVTLVLVAAWVAAAMAARRHYVASLHRSIYEHRLDVERLSEQTAERAAIDALVAALGDEDAAVRREAVRALAAADERGAVALVDPLLSDPDAGVRAEALVYLAKCGGVDPLTRVADPANVDHAALSAAIAHFLARPGAGETVEAVRVLLEVAPAELRQDIPEVLGRIGTPEADRLLVDYLFDADPIVRLRAVSALNKLRQADGQAVEANVIEVVLAAEIFGHYRSHQLIASGDPSAPANGMMEAELERIFRLMKLMFPQHDLHSAWVGVQSTNPAIHGHALEFLEQTLPPRIRTLLLPLVDSDVSEAERVAIAERMTGLRQA